MFQQQVRGVATVNQKQASLATRCTQTRSSALIVRAAGNNTEQAQPIQSSRRQLLGLGALLSLAPAVAPTPVSAEPALPPTSVPGAALDLDGQVTVITPADVASLKPSEKQVYSQNRRIQAQNRLNEDFPGFIRSGFDVKVVGENLQVTPSGLIYRDYREGSGSTPQEGQEVVFHYTGYNESGTVIDSSYRQGQPAQTRLGIQGMIPGFEEGIRGMRVGQQRRIIIPPALGPPVGPSTFFSAKQCEVFDVELLAIRTCERRQMAMFSDVVCT